MLCLVLVVPLVWFPFALGKTALFALAMLAAAILFVSGGGTAALSRSRGFYIALFVCLIPLAYLLSTAYSVNPAVAFLGQGVEVDTILFTLLAFLAFILSFALFRTLRTVRILLATLTTALVVAAAFQSANIFIPSMPLQSFADQSANLIGKWNDLGILLGLLFLLLLSRLELMSTPRIGARLLWAGLSVLTVVLLGFVNFALVWWFILAGSVVIAATSLLERRGTEASLRSNGVPWFAAAGAALSIAFLIYGGAVNAALTSFFPVSSLEVRPSYIATLEIVSTARDGKIKPLLIGTGPSTFLQNWLLHKPAEVNQSVFWNLDFLVGFSTLTTALLTVGVIGVLAWLVPISLVLLAAARALRQKFLTREDIGEATSIVLSSSFLFAVLLLYVPSPNIVLAAFISAGAAFGFLWRQGRPREEAANTGFNRLAAAAVAVLLVALSIVPAIFGAKRLASNAFIAYGQAALAQGDEDSALAASARAAIFEETGDSLMLKTGAGMEKLVSIAATVGEPTDDVRRQFTSLVQESIAAGQRAHDQNPADYRPDVALGKIYDFLAGLRVQGAEDSARAAYDAAAERNPTNPQIPLLRAVFEARAGNMQQAQVFVSQALTQKSNYTDAMLFVVQTAAASNDMPTATRAAQAAAQTAPGVPSIWFQLGLLYYSQGMMSESITSLRQAISLAPDYANAKYFLGLALAAEGQNEEALNLFADLQKGNPDNEEVLSIINNLQQGNEPFAGVKDEKPEQRATAPIAE
ncbi:hypothetical protein A2852_02870 [Candidatus Adlerbacteria bacterium RIFCSPHIGHO2_01_FULL_54_23]|nr:MAG: hypothetical protein A2852_02870 [Candidatus Adlerbacteria bacterium RIFCSPHIGHO2_01_FULL_54_23]